MALKTHPAASSKFDILSLGECMIRFAPPGHGRIEFSKTLEVDVGGGEFNVAYACARLGLRGGFISKLPDNPLASIILNHARAVGMDVSHVAVETFDGVGRSGRVGLNFTEVGTGVRPSVTLYDRGHSSISRAKPDEFNFDAIFGQKACRWLHTGGVMASLSKDSAVVVRKATAAARANGTVVSYDLNFRSKLWSSSEAIETTRSIIPNVDVLIGNEEDFEKVLGFTVEGTNARYDALPVENYKKMVERVVDTFPGIKAVCTTLREVKSGLVNNWGGILWEGGHFYDARGFKNLEIEDRVGGGDGFSGGVAYGFLSGMEPQEIVNFGCAHGALIQTTRGDTSQVNLEEVLHVARGGSARIKR